MNSREISPVVTVGIIAAVLLLILAGGYFLFLRPKDPEGISDAKLTPQQRAEQKAGASRVMQDYLNERNRGK